jgi:aminoglycoside/choline kinase family phosphotransferase
MLILEDVHRWCAAQLAQAGRHLAGDFVPVRANAWSTVLQVPTTAGPCYFKACAPTMAAEVRLLPLLASHAPDLLPQILAADPAAGWLLLDDGGDLLRPILKADRNLDHWRRVLAAYAALQRSLQRDAPALLACGVWDRTPAALPAQYMALLDDADALLLDRPDGLRGAEHARLLALAPAFAADCAALAAVGIPASIDHSDLHDGNILLRGGRYVLIDWGDACVGHPFMTLPVTLRSIAYHLELDAADPALANLRDGYLAAWADFGTLTDLRAAFARAQRISMVNRALTWREALRHATPAQRAAHADAAPGWLQEYLGAMEG